LVESLEYAFQPRAEGGGPSRSEEGDTLSGQPAEGSSTGS